MAMKFQFQRSHVLSLMTALVIVAVVSWIFLRHQPDSLRVPLGVEQAAIVTYSGPRLTVAPYKWGVAVNVRIAEVIEQAGRRVYDLRYIVNRAGTFDLKDYLAAEDGSALDGLPTFEFTGDPELSKNLDTRIQDTEQVGVDVGGRYYETLAGLTALWIGWLLLLLFYKRTKPPAGPDTGQTEPTVAEQLRGFLAQLEAGTLDAAAKAKMEMALLHCWRDELALGDRRMSAALAQIGRDEKTRDGLKKLQHWLHHPASPVPSVDIAEVIRRHTPEVAP